MVTAIQSATMPRNEDRMNNGDAELFSELAAVLGGYASARTTGKVVEHLDYAALKSKLKALDIQVGSQSWDSVWTTVHAYLDNSVKTAHPQYFNQLWAGQSEPALVGSIIEAIANTSMYTYEVAPVATIIENEMLSVFKRIFGFESGDAQVTSGGSNSNYVALLLALHRKFPDLKQSGLYGLPKCAVFVSSEAHYSMDKASVMSGIGLDSLYKIPTDDRGVMRTDELQKQIQACIDEGRVPVSIIGTAGTTVRGVFDDFESLAKIAKKYDCWLHVDGAWGGAVAFSSEQRRFLQGFDKADSMTWDAHKMLGVPLMCGVLFTRDTGGFDQVCNLGDTSYIFHDSEDRQDLGPYSLQCGRRVDMLKMWLEYIYYGQEGLEARIDHFMHLSAIAEKRIKAEPSLELQTERWINNICFRSTVCEDGDLNSFNKAVRQRLYTTGSSFVNIAYLNDDLTIRLIITNKDVTEADIHKFFDLWLAAAAETNKEMMQCA